MNRTRCLLYFVWCSTQKDNKMYMFYLRVANELYACYVKTFYCHANENLLPRLKMTDVQLLLSI